MDPIDEIDGKKKRRAMLENMQRSSSLFQARVQKKETEAAEKALAQQLEAPKETEDLLDFSSEFSNQETGLNSQGQGSTALRGWEDLIDDDDWLSGREDEGQEGQAEGDQGGEESPEGDRKEEPAESAEGMIAPPSGWRGSSLPNSSFFPGLSSAASRPKATPTPESDSQTPSAEERLGFSWGPIQKREEPSKSSEGVVAPLGSQEGDTVVPLAVPNVFPGKEMFPRNREAGSRNRPSSSEPLPIRGQAQKLDSDVAAAARLLIQTPEEEPGYEECLRLLCRFGLGAVRLCNRSKVKVHILDEHEFLTFPALAELGLDPSRVPVDGAYLVESRTCLIDRRCLTEKPRFFHPALYYFAHALDHAQGGEDFSSRKAAAVLACFEASCEGMSGCDFVDELAATDPVRYFARSVSIYLERDDCSEAIWTNRDLLDFDRSMYDYLDYLFARFSA